MIAGFLPVSSAWLGFEVLRYFTGSSLSIFEIIGASFPVGVLVTSITGLCLNTFLRTSFLHFVILVSASVLASFVLHRKNRRKGALRLSWRKAHKPSVLFILVCCFGLFWLTNKALFPRKDQIIATGNNDMMLEIAMINSFYTGVNKMSSFLTRFQIPLDLSIRTFTEAIPAFYCGLMRAGLANMKTTLRFVTYGLFTSASILIYTLVKRATKSELLACLAIPSLFLVGGFGFTGLANSDNRNNTNADFVFYMGTGGVVPWGHPLVHCLLTSRLALLSLVNAMITFILLDSERDLYAGILCIVQIFVRPHSGFALSIAFALYNLKYRKQRLIFIPVLLFLSYVMLPVHKIPEKRLWNSGIPNASMIPFISLPFHIYGTLFIAMLLCLKRAEFHRVLAPMSVFWTLCFVKMQPDHRFNFMSLIPVVTPLVVVAAMTGLSWLRQLFTDETIQGCLTALILFVVGISWASSLCGIHHKIDQTVTINGDDQSDIAKWAVKNTKRNSVFCAPSELWWNPAVTRAGRVQYISYQSTLQDFAVNTTRSSEVKRFMGNPTWKIPEIDYWVVPKEHAWSKALNRSTFTKWQLSTFSYDVYSSCD